MQKIILITGIILVMFNINLFAKYQADTVDVNKFEELKDSGYIVIDVRTDEEFNEEHIEGAVLINIYSPDFNDRINSLDKNSKYLVYCRSGNRSNKAAIRMNEIGIKTAYNLVGGIIAWKKAGKKTVK